MLKKNILKQNLLYSDTLLSGALHDNYNILRCTNMFRIHYMLLFKKGHGKFSLFISVLDSTFCNFSLYERLWSLCLWYRIKLSYLPTFTARKTFSSISPCAFGTPLLFLKTDEWNMHTHEAMFDSCSLSVKTRLLLHAQPLKNTTTSIEKTVPKFFTDEIWCNSFTKMVQIYSLFFQCISTTNMIHSECRFHIRERSNPYTQIKPLYTMTERQT